MFGIKVRNRFLDLEQTKFNVRLQSPFLFGSSQKDILPASLLLTTKAGPTKNNFLLLDSPHLITNPRAFLKNEPAEIWSNGSVIYFGKLDVTESTTDGHISVRVLINSLADLKDLNLQDIDFPTITGDLLQLCNAASVNPQTFDFLCPAVYAPFQASEEKGYFSLGNFQNYYQLGNVVELIKADYATICPFPKMTVILRGLMKKIGFDLENCFEDSQELRQLLLYYANPLFTPNAIHNDSQPRFGNFNLKRHVPNMKSSEFLKAFIRHFNLGLLPSTFENVVKIIKTEDLTETNITHDWTKKVLKIGIIKDLEPFLNKYKISMPTALGSNPFSLHAGEFEFDDTRPEYIFDDPDAITPTSYLMRNRKPADPPTGIYWKDKPKDKILFNRDINHPRFLSAATEKAVYESKVSFLPTGTIEKNYRKSALTYNAFLPCSQDKNALANGDAEATVLPLFFDRDNTRGIPTGSSEAVHKDGTSYTNNGVASKHDIAFGGENGVYNRFWKKWDNFLQGKKRIEINLDLEIADLRRFSFENKIFIGNYEGFAETIDIEFNQNGLSAVKAVLIV